MAQFTAIILAAGTSTRMGEENKLLLPCRGKTVLSCVVEAVCSSAIDDVIVVTGHQDRKIRDVLESYQVRITYNPEFAEGISTSIRRGIVATTQEADGFVICLGDMPLITDLTIRRLCEVFLQQEEPSIVVATFRGQRGHPVIFHSSFRDALTRLDGDSGAKRLIERHAEKVVEVEVRDEQVIADIDTWEAYDEIRTL